MTEFKYEVGTPIGQLIEAIQFYAQSYWREKIAEEIEDYRVANCRCDSELKPNCEALLDVIKIIKKELE